MSINKLKNVTDAITQKVKISIDGYSEEVIYYDLQLGQNLLGHHTFQFRWRFGNSPIIDFKTQADVIRRYMGSKVLIRFKDATQSIDVYFKGIINQMEMLDADGASKGFMVYGMSPTILLDDVTQNQVFENQSLSQIAQTITNHVPKGLLTGSIVKLKQDSSLQYIVQYNETDFEFLKRLATQYGVWMFYDGEYLKFGETKNAQATLTSGRNLHDFTIKSSLLPQKVAGTAYDYGSSIAVKRQSMQPQSNSKSYFARNVQRKSSEVFNRTNNYYNYTARAGSQTELEEIKELYQQGREAQAVTYSGRSILPLQIGGDVKIIKDGIETSLIVTSLSHHSKGIGHYDCYFEAIPADVKAPPYTNPYMHPIAESQPATVADNNDPMGMGRVRVRFAWQQESTWLRMVTPHAGGGKGFYFVPEIGEEVMIGFEGGNPEKPYVLGTHYNGAKSSGYSTGDNSIKAIHTRSGHIIKFTEDDSILITDKSGNEIHLDTRGSNINITAPETMTLNAKNMNINVGENLTTNVGMNNIENVGMMKTTSVAGDANVMITGKLMEYIEGDVHSETKAERTEVSEGKIVQQSKGEMQHHSAKVVRNNSGEKGHNS